MVDYLINMESFEKYRQKSAMHWKEFMTLDPRYFNAVHAARHKNIIDKIDDTKGKKILD